MRHYTDCRTRIEEELKKTDDGRRRLGLATDRKDKALERELERLEGEQEEDSKRRKILEELEAGPSQKSEVSKSRGDEKAQEAPDVPMLEPSGEKRTTEDASIEDKLAKKVKLVRGEVRKIEEKVRSQSQPPGKQQKTTSSSSTAGTESISYCEEDRQCILEANSFVQALDFDHDISEIYNPNVFCSRARYFGLKPGYAFDLTQSRASDGQAWDFRQHSHRRDA